MNESNHRIEIDTVVHDVRNALSPVFSYAQLLEAILSENGTEEQKNLCTKIVEGLRQADRDMANRMSSGHA